jgi:hypothetical protein
VFGLAAVGLLPLACGGGGGEGNDGGGGTGQSRGGAGGTSSAGTSGRGASGGSGGGVSGAAGTSGGTAGSTGAAGTGAGASGGTTGTGGAAGTAGGRGGSAGGTAGATGAAGSSSAGRGGTGGSAGTTGAAGSSSAGRGGTGGSAGTTGAAGSSAGQGGTSGTVGAAGSGAAAGTGGAAGRAGGGGSAAAGTGGASAAGSGGASGASQCTTLAEGATCVAVTTGGATGVCHVGACVHGCFINNTFVGVGATNPANVCQYCDQTMSISNWTSRPNCGGGCPAPAIAPKLYTYATGPYGEMVYDTSRGQVVGFGAASTQTSATAIWDGATWIGLNNNPIPPAAVNVLLLPPPVYDSARNRAVAFSGAGTTSGTYTNTTWEWDEQSWMTVTPSDLIPRARIGHVMVFDASLGRTVIFGGSSRDGTISTLFDTWAWDGASWTRLVPTASPAPANVGPMAYDSGRSRSVLLSGAPTTFGTVNGTYGLALTTWELAGSTWTSVATDNLTIYSQTWSAVTAYDSTRQRTVRLFQRAGSLNANTSVVMDEWNGSTWTNVPLGFTLPMNPYNPVYDAARRRLFFRADAGGGGVYAMYEVAWEPLPDRAPTVPAIPAQVVFAHDTLTVTAQATDPDQNPVTYTATGLPSGASMTTGGVFSWTPTEAQTGTYMVTVTASDGCLTGSAAFKISAYWITYSFPQGTLSATGPLTLPVTGAGGTGSAKYNCTLSGTNPGKLTLACLGNGGALYANGFSTSISPPDVQTPILPDLSYSYAQGGTTMAGRVERLSDGTYLVHVTAYTAPGFTEMGADNTGNLQ